MTRPVLGWHFVKDDRTLRDGSKLVIGKRLVHKGDLILCGSGYHASKRIIDAIQYAPGSTICRVRCEGNRLDGGDKIVCEKRTALWAINGEKVMRAFARRCALDVIDKWNAPEVVRRYLETGDESLRAAAWDAARAAAWAAAWDAAWEKYNRWLTAMVKAAKVKP